MGDAVRLGGDLGRGRVWTRTGDQLSGPCDERPGLCLTRCVGRASKRWHGPESSSFANRQAGVSSSAGGMVVWRSDTLLSLAWTGHESQGCGG